MRKWTVVFVAVASSAALLGVIAGGAAAIGKILLVFGLVGAAFALVSNAVRSPRIAERRRRAPRRTPIHPMTTRAPR